MKLSEMYPRRFATGEDLNGKPATLTISKLVQEKMRPQPGAPEAEKWVLFFKETKKGVILSRTLAYQIGEIVGSEDTADWIGKTITIFPLPMNVAGRSVTTIRARATAPSKTTQPQPVPDFQEEPQKTAEQAAPAPKTGQPTQSQDPGEAVTPSNGRPYPPEKVKAKIAEAATALKDANFNSEWPRLLRHGLELCLGDLSNEKTGPVVSFLAGVDDPALVDNRTMRAMLEKWLEISKAKDGSGEYTVSPMAAREALLIADKA